MRVYCVLWDSTANVCQFISSRFAMRKPSFLWSSPHKGRLHLLFSTSWLYFSSKFQANVQWAKKEALPVHEREHYCYCSLWAGRSSPLARQRNNPDSVSPLQNHLPISRNIWVSHFGRTQGSVCVCVVSVYSVWPLTKTSCILTLGGEDGGHAETHVFRLHYGLTMQSNGITAICDLWVGVCNRGELTGDRRSNTTEGEDRLHWMTRLSKPALRLQTQTWTNWLRNGVNHGPFKGTTVLNTLPSSKSLLPNKGVKRRFCLPPFWGVTGGLKDTNEHENRNKVANSQ